MGGRRARWLMTGVTSALVGAMLQTTGPPNGPCPTECKPGTGYDFVTGLGSPRAGIDQALAAAR
jgi:hypothetical protein